MAISEYQLNNRVKFFQAKQSLSSPSVFVKWQYFSKTPLPVNLQVKIGDDFILDTHLVLTTPKRHAATLDLQRREASVPSKFWDSSTITVDAFFFTEDDSGGQELVATSSADFCCAPIGKLEYFENGIIYGWIADSAIPSRSLPCSLLSKDSSLEVVDVNMRHRLDVAKDIGCFNNSCLNGIEARVFFKEPELASSDFNTRHLISLFARDNSLSVKLDSREFVISKHDAFNANIRSLLQRGELPSTVFIADNNIPELSKQLTRRQAHHPYIVIPIYDGLVETVNCIYSVLHSTSDDIQIVLVNDKSPCTYLTQQIRKIALNHARVHLFENKSNIGFPGTVNIGLNFNEAADVIILNSDTLCPQSDWVSRMSQCAYSNYMIGTVTPMTTNGSICGYPLPNQDNIIPYSLSVSKLDQIFSIYNQDTPPVLAPTGVGFCMYIKRDFLTDVGLIDESIWGRGYCEENDLCLRGLERGWISVISPDVFIQHLGSVSFKEEKISRISGNISKLHSMYPYYSDFVKDFIAFDPVKRVRIQANRALVKNIGILGNSLVAVHVSHSIGGGIATYIDGAVKNQLKYHDNFLLQYLPHHNAYLGSFFNKEDEYFMEYCTFTESELFTWLRQLNPKVYIHSLISYPSSFIKHLQCSHMDINYIMHDFLAFCPRYTLLRHGAQCYQISNPSICQICLMESSLPSDDIRNQYHQLGGSIQEWRKVFYDLLSACKKITFSSQSAFEITKGYLPADSEFLIVPNDESDNQLISKLSNYSVRHSSPKERSKANIKIALIGAIAYHKGYKELVALANYLEERSSNVTLVVIGFTLDDSAFKGLNRTRILGKYNTRNLDSIISSENPDCALFLSKWPETYSYTLSAAFDNMIPSAAYDIGAQAERIRKTGYGVLFNLDSDCQAIINACIDAASLKVSDDT